MNDARNHHRPTLQTECALRKLIVDERIFRKRSHMSGGCLEDIKIITYRIQNLLLI
jgi:hypothetical protein